MNNDFTANHELVEGKKSTLVKDLKDVASNAQDLLKAVTNATAEEFAVTSGGIEARLGDAKAKLDDARLVITDRAKQVAGATSSYVHDSPWQAMGIVAAVGFITGYLLGRR